MCMNTCSRARKLQAELKIWLRDEVDYFLNSENDGSKFLESHPIVAPHSRPMKTQCYHTSIGTTSTRTWYPETTYHSL